MHVKESKVVFAAFTQYCIQRTVTHFVTHVEGVEGVNYYVLYSVYRASHPSEGKAICYLKSHLVGLAVHHQSV